MVYFAQTLSLSNSTGSGPVTKASTILAGNERYLGATIIAEMPSAWSAPKGANCSTDDLGRGPGLTSCQWYTDLLPSPGRVSKHKDDHRCERFNSQDLALTAPSPAVTVSD